MPLSWNEIKSRAMAFSKRWADAGNDEGEADLTKPCWPNCSSRRWRLVAAMVTGDCGGKSGTGSHLRHQTHRLGSLRAGV